MRESNGTDLHAGKTLGWAGATPNWTALSRPKFLGVAPAHHAGSVTVFCPRACAEVVGPNASTEDVLITWRSKSQCQS